jgi:beta-lysine 5,6-aminomutase alpha subunit
MAREIFPKSPLKYMPPTKHMTGNIFKGHIQNAMFNVVSIITEQGIQLLGMLTEAIHTPFMSDRYLSIENAKYIFNNLRNIADEIEFKKDGIIHKRAQQVLDESIALLEKMNQDGLFVSLSKGTFASIKRPVDGGKGLEGVFEKGKHYFNPFITKMLEGKQR